MFMDSTCGKVLHSTVFNVTDALFFDADEIKQKFNNVSITDFPRAIPNFFLLAVIDQYKESRYDERG